MVKIKKQYILMTCFTSGIAAILSLASLGTEQWIVSEGIYDSTEIAPTKIKYGLFSGTLRKDFIMQITYVISMTCDYGENACALLCKNSAEERKKELRQLLSGQVVKFDDSCPRVQTRSRSLNNSPISKRKVNQDRTFINAGVYLSTLIFLVISSAFGVLSTFLSVWNTGGNPIYSYFNIYGLYIYNGIASFFSCLVLCVWGAEYNMKLIDNLGVLYSITGEMQTENCFLGFSYWLNIGAMILYGLSIFLLWFRQHTINKEPEVKLDIEDVDDNIILY